MADTVRINLALQGGGAHGAFTWGVLDRILDEEDIEIASISGTSAGALNGAALKSGLVGGGREGAREMLDWLWGTIGRLDDFALPTWLEPWLPAPDVVSRSVEYSALYMWGEAVGRMLSPYSWGPLYRNPLERIVQRFDFERICAKQGPEFFVCATCVRDGKIRVFEGDTLCTESILASACLPTLFQAVTAIDPLTGEPEQFWDGGYTGNPALYPMFPKHLPADILVVNINPLERDCLPVTPQEIGNRINEISFNSSLLRELRAIDFVQRLIDDERMTEDAMKRPRIHMISDDALMNGLSVATKMIPIPALLRELKAAGWRAADAFLDAHRDDLGKCQTADLRAMFG